MPKTLTAHDGLEIWRRALSGSVSGDGPDLTARQMALMLTVYLTPQPHTVRGLAALLNVSKPAITRAIDRLSELDFIRRKPDDADRRSVLVQRTIRGSVYLRDFGEQIVRAAKALEG